MKINGPHQVFVGAFVLSSMRTSKTLQTLGHNNAGTNHLTLSAIVTNMTQAEDISGKSHDPRRAVWYVGGLCLEGAKWSPQEPSDETGSLSSHYFVQQPVQSMLPIVELRVSNVCKRNLHGLVPVYQSRQQNRELVAVLQFEDAGGDDNWAAAASIFLQTSDRQSF